MPIQKFNRSILEAAIVGFEAQKKELDSQIAGLRQMLDGSPTLGTVATTEPTTRKGRKMSAAARKRIGDAQRKRWAESKGQSEAVAPEPAKAKRKLSKAGRANIVAALKKRWATKNAAAKKAAVKAPSAKAAKRAAPVKKAKAKKRTAAAPAQATAADGQ